MGNRIKKKGAIGPVPGKIRERDQKFRPISDSEWDMRLAGNTQCGLSTGLERLYGSKKRLATLSIISALIVLNPILEAF